ncbi:MAG: immunity 49 family protein [Nannocystis sp.]|nr:immunity 49 family protein [Nannocystis sp.]MBA3547989.1 immunity 49 family protein [Nannocystis sp.]
MKTIPAHKIDAAMLAEKHAITLSYLDDILPLLPNRPDVLRGCALNAMALAAGGVALGEDAQAPARLRLSARLSALQYAHAASEAASTIELEDGSLLTVEGETDESEINFQYWLDAMWCALACGDVVAQHWLAAVDFARLAPEGIRFNAYLQPYAGSLRSLVSGEGEIAELLEQAIARCEPSSPELEFTQKRIDQLDYPALKALFLLLADEPEDFDEALIQLLEGHRKFWQSPQNALAEDGRICLPALALRRMAAQRAQDVAVQSPYLPASVWQAAAPTALSLCPYCLSPKSPAASHCGVCQRDTRNDAPLELSSTRFIKGPHKACRPCAMPVDILAVTCPRCRKRP